MASNTTYGDYIRAIPQGVAGIGWPLSIAGFAVLIVGFIAMNALWWVGLIVLGVGLGTIAILSVRDRQHRNIADRLVERQQYAQGVRKGRGLYRSGMLGLMEHGGTPLPGILSKVELMEALDGAGRPFALLHHTHTGEYTLPIACYPQGASLVDDDDEDQYVAGWAAFLESMARTAGVMQVSVCVDTSPDSGSRTQRILSKHVTAGPEDLAGRAMSEVMLMLSRGGARNDVIVSIDFKYQDMKGRPLPDDEAARTIANLIPGIISSLGQSGGGMARTLDADEMATMARTAYDPRTLEEFEQQEGENPVHWEDCGPTACEASWDFLRHDSGLSRTWEMCDPPRSLVTADTMANLLQPLDAVDRKRVTLVFRLLDSAKSRVLSEDNRKRSTAAEGQQKHVTVSTVDTQHRADRQAMDVNAGANLIWFGMLVTATVMTGRDEENRLEKASRAVEGAAGAASVDLRVCYGAQDTGFAAGLPFGIDLAAYRPPSLMGSLG
ncbi:MAG: hypothetical protein LKI88_03785 [Bifidobacterium sp.]|jgi:hypothetical protein|nr:hypothetical protein [Bifidobacterium sp.]MCI1865041.1 hypothetical protein [Bifidobacterium sp.]